MSYNPKIYNRHSIRLPGYDYSQAGVYFVTIVTQNRKNLFGEIVGAGSKPAQMRLNEYGEIVKNTWDDLIHHVRGIELDAFVIMPNHIHGIIVIVGDLRAGSKPALTRNSLQNLDNRKQQPLQEIIRQFKTFSARYINEKRHMSGTPVWQRNYYEHVIRNEKSYDEISAYIANNPSQWKMDKLFIS